MTPKDHPVAGGEVVRLDLAIPGKQRLQNCRVRANIEALRNFRKFVAGEIDFIPCSGDRLSDLIAHELDRVAAAALSARKTGA